MEKCLYKGEKTVKYKLRDYPYQVPKYMIKLHQLQQCITSTGQPD